MKFDLASDLHVDLSPKHHLDWKRLATSDTIVVAGDTSNNPKRTIHVMEDLSKVYKTVLFIDGNHEGYSNRANNPHYSVTPMNMYQRLRDAFQTNPNVVFLDHGLTSHIQDGVAFIGANAWYDFRYKDFNPDICRHFWKTKMNDAHYCNITDVWVENKCKEQVDNLVNSVTTLNQNPDVEKIVLVTHTVPMLSGVSERNYEWNVLNGCYYNSQLHRAHFGKVVAHCFGHTHRRQMYRENGIQFFCNPRGYYGEPGFDKWEPMCIDLDDNRVSAFGEIE